MRKILLCIALIVVASFCCGWALCERNYWLTALFVLIAAQSVYRLARLVGRNDRSLTFLLEALRNGATSMKFSERGSDAEVNRRLNEIKTIVSGYATDAARREKYYEIILNRSETGIIVINDDGHIYQHNPKALKLLGLNVLTHIDQISKVSAQLRSRFLEAETGKDYVVQTGNSLMMIMMQVSRVELSGKRLRIFTLNEITRAMESNEAETWKKLTRVLTHEIMNSLAPITSMSDMLLKDSAALDGDVKLGLETIKSSSNELLRFTRTYRSITQPPKPSISTFSLLQAIERGVRSSKWLEERGAETVNVDFREPAVRVKADEGLIVRVVSNLLNNAAEAGADRVEIRAALSEENSVAIDIENNGSAIPYELAEQIFTPFFTMKSDGNGIGLSLSRQIMTASGGSLTLQSLNPVVFRLIVPC